MVLPTVNVTGQVVDAGGNPVASAIVTAKLSGADVYGSEYINASELSFTADAQGNFTLAIFPNALGSLNTSYAIKLKSADGQTIYRTVNCVVPNRACTLASIEGTGPAAPSNTLQSIEYAMNLPFWDQTMKYLSLIKNFNSAVRSYIFPDVSGTVLVLAGALIAGMASVQADGSIIDRTLTGTANQVIIANGDGVAGNPTFSLPQNIHTGATPTFAGLTLTGALAANGGITVPTGQSITGAGTASISGFASIAGTTIATSGDLTVGGNLIVNGTTATVNSTTLNVTDPLVKYANGNTANVIDIGFYGQYQPAATPLFTGLFRDATDGVYKLYDSLQTEPTTTVNIAGAGYAAAALTVGAFNAYTVTASGQITSTLATGTAPLVVASTTQVANLNASQLVGATWAAPSAIGSVTPNTGAFTTLSASGASTLAAVTASGLLTANAGIGIPTGQNVTGAGTAQVTGFATISATNLTGTLTTPAQPNVTSVGTLTSLTTSGLISNTSGLTIPITFTGATAGAAYGSITNTSGALVWGVGGSSGGPIVGGTPYAAFIGSNTAKDFQLLYNGSAIATINATGLSLGSNSLTAGAISGTTGAFSGNVTLGNATASTLEEVTIQGGADAGKGAALWFRKSAINGGIGNLSAWDGSTSNDIALVAATGQQVGIYANGSTTATSIFSPTGLNVTGDMVATGRVKGQASIYAIYGLNGSNTQPTGLMWNADTTGNNIFMEFDTEGGSGTMRGTISYNRGGGLVAYNTTSDARLKNDLGIATDTTALRNLRVHNFTWKNTGNKAVGVFAQEAYQVYPAAVTPGTNGSDLSKPWQVSYSAYVPDLIVGWQNHESRISALERKLGATQ